MEYAIFASKVEHLKYCDDNFSRLYFGNEFCQYLLPTVLDMEHVLDFARSLNFTLVTPYVTDEGLAALKSVLDLVSQRKSESEVVFNDWGVLSILRDQYPSLEPVMGRLLNKMKRGPRLVTVLNSMTEDSIEYFRSSNLSVPLFRRFLLDKRVRRAEFDNVFQGIAFDFGEMELSLYMPFAYVTTTRACLVNACDIPEKGDLVGIFPCQQECQKYTFYLESEVMPVTLVRRGNTVFFRNEEIPQGFGRVSRVVIEPEIPM
jgi:hypothetical protein